MTSTAAKFYDKKFFMATIYLMIAYLIAADLAT